MGSCSVEVCYIPIEHTLELLLAEDQQVVKACLSDTPQEAFAHRIGAGSVIRRSRHFNGTRRCHSGKTGSKLAILSQIRYFGTCPYGVASRSCCATQGSVGDLVTPTWITRRVLSSIMKKAKSGRKKRSVTCKKSQAQISAA